MKHISYPYEPRSCDPTLIFCLLDICAVNRRPLAGLCLDSNEDQGTTEHLANLDHMGIWFRKCDEYQQKDGDALRLGSKGRYGSCVGGR